MTEIMPLNVLYDVTIRNLTNNQLAAIQNVIFNAVDFEREPKNDRAVEFAGTQHPTQIDMWDLKFYHLKPAVAHQLQGVLFQNKLYPVIIELKGYSL